MKPEEAQVLKDLIDKLTEKQEEPVENQEDTTTEIPEKEEKTPAEKEFKESVKESIGK